MILYGNQAKETMVGEHSPPSPTKGLSINGVNKNATKMQQKGPVKLIQWVKITHSFLHLKSKLFHPVIFSLSG